MLQFENHPIGKAILSHRSPEKRSYELGPRSDHEIGHDEGIKIAFRAAEQVVRERCDSFTRCFAPEGVVDSPDYETMREWSAEEQLTMFDVRGAGGDEIMYSELLDSFCFQPGSGDCKPMYVSNPWPSNVLGGARIVARLADAVWSN